jgi:hypothetical protein
MVYAVHCGIYGVRFYMYDIVQPSTEKDEGTFPMSKYLYSPNLIHTGSRQHPLFTNGYLKQPPPPPINSP